MYASMYLRASGQRESAYYRNTRNAPHPVYLYSHGPFGRCPRAARGPSGPAINVTNK